MRPSPASARSAISPRFGPTKRTPSFSSVARLRRVAGCDHIFGFMAGAISTGLSVASSTAEARSLARPLASLAIRSAVAGATTMRSASRDKPDMADILLVLAVEQLGEDMVGGQRADRQRRDEMLRGRGHHGAHRSAALAQPADQVERLVGGDAAADDQEDALAGEGHRAGRSRFVPRRAIGALRSRALRRRDRRSVRHPQMQTACRLGAFDAVGQIGRALPAPWSTPLSAARLRNSRFTLSSRLRR